MAGSTSTSDTNWLYSNLVEVAGFTQIRFLQIQTTTAGTTLGYAFYDEDENYIEGASNSGQSVTWTLVE